MKDLTRSQDHARSNTAVTSGQPKSLGEKMFDAFTDAGQPYGPFDWSDASPTLQAAWNRAAVAFTASLSDAPAWQPIATVPLGTRVLVSNAKWKSVLTDSFYDEEYKDERLANWENGPTHWMPTPPTPATGGQ